MKRSTQPHLRSRNVAHLWADKQVFRFFRKTFPKPTYKHLRSVYLALCEIDSDFGEGKEIIAFSKTVSTYSGVGIDSVHTCLQILCAINLIERTQQITSDGRFGKTTLTMYKWEEPVPQKLEQMLKVTGKKARDTKNPLTGKPVDGKTSRFKNNNKLLIYNFGNFLKLFPQSWRKDKPFQTTLRKFFKYRIEQDNPLNDNSGKKIRTKLINCSSIEIAIDGLEQAIDKKWTSVFPKQTVTPQSSPQQQLMDWYATKRQMPSDKELQKLFASGESHKCSQAERWMLCPSPKMLVEDYQTWIEEQAWITTPDSPALFKSSNKIFKSFFAQYQKDIGVNFLTGQRL